MDITDKVKLIGNKAYKLSLDMPSKVFIREEIELKDILGYINKFVEKEDWNVKVIGMYSLNQKFYMKIITTFALLLQIIFIISNKTG